MCSDLTLLEDFVFLVGRFPFISAHPGFLSQLANSAFYFKLD